MAVLIFDLGGVVFTNGTKLAAEKIGKMFGIAARNVEDVLKGDDGKAYRRGLIDGDVFWERAKERLGIDLSTERLSEIWHSSYKPVEGMFGLLEKLSKRHALYFLSDNTKERVEYLSKYGFMKYFKGGLFSYEAGMTKDNPEIFLALLEKFSIPASQSIYIDDKPEMVERAKGLGMEGIVFSGIEELEKALRELGVEW